MEFPKSTAPGMTERDSPPPSYYSVVNSESAGVHPTPVQPINPMPADGPALNHVQYPTIYGNPMPTQYSEATNPTYYYHGASLGGQATTLDQPMTVYTPARERSRSTTCRRCSIAWSTFFVLILIFMWFVRIMIRATRY